MTDFLKIAKSIVVHFAHICAYGVETVKDLGIINPEQICPYTFNMVEKLAKRFPQLDLHTSNSLDRLREEFTDFKLSPGDHPSLEKPD